MTRAGVPPAREEQEHRPAIQTLIDVMAYYKHSMTDFEAQLWNRLIEEFDDGPVISFLQAHVGREKFKPMVNEALAMLRPGANDAAAAFLAMSSAVSRCGPYASPVFEDPALPGAILRLGGWVAVNEQLPSPEARFDYEGYQKRFEVAYQIACAEVLVHKRMPAPLQGLHAITNSSKPALPAPEQVPDSVAAGFDVLPAAGGDRQIEHVREHAREHARERR